MTPIELLPGAVEAAQEFLREDEATMRRMDRVAALIDGFEDAYGLELLSSVHWVMCGVPEARKQPEAAIAAVHRWSARKRRVLKPEHVVKAWHRLKDQRWDETLVE